MSIIFECNDTMASSTKLQLQFQSNLVLGEVGGDDIPDDVSSPTVSIASYSDDDLSFDLHRNTTSDSPYGHQIDSFIDDDISSSSSINSRAHKQITELKRKLHTAEMTKIELLNHLAEVESQLEKMNCKEAKAKVYRQETLKLREESAHMERDFMNEVTKIVMESAKKEEVYLERLSEKDKRIEQLERDLRLMRKYNYSMS